ncbi:MAG: hypothetical protein IPK64_09615 [bacterium]|nr:hypothetical protein [bacterium]
MLQDLLDIVIFFARNMVAAFAVFFGACLLLGRHVPSVRLRPAAAWAASLGLLGVFAGIAAWYVGLEGLAGEVEPAVTTLSWLVSNGHPLYMPFEAAERYSVLYGPSVFLTNGVFLKVLGPTLASVKLVSALAAVGSLLLLYATLARNRRDTPAILLTATAAMYLWAQGFAVYVVRPDALMVFSVALALFGAARLRRPLAIIAVAVATGFAVNLKLHGFLYFVPVAALLGLRHGRGTWMIAAVGALMVAALPFLFNPLVSLVDYFAWIGNASHHGLSTEFLALDLGYAAALVLPLALVLVLSGWTRWRGKSEGVLVLALASVLPAVLVLASKPGAGLVHLLPMAIPTVYVLGRLVQRLQVEGFDWRPARRRSVAWAFGLTLLLAGSVNEYRAVRRLDWQTRQLPDLAQDVRGVMAHYGGLTMAMACGGEAMSFQSTWTRTLLAFGDHPVLLDPISVMDSSLSGRELSHSTYDAIGDGRIALWLVPRGQEPFRKVNWYAPHLPVFPEAFRSHFAAHYSRRAQSRYFDLWFWNGLPAVASGRGLGSDPGGVMAR